MAASMLVRGLDTKHLHVQYKATLADWANGKVMAFSATLL